jgi:hypothetical protein
MVSLAGAETRLGPRAAAFGSSQTVLSALYRHSDIYVSRSGQSDTGCSSRFSRGTRRDVAQRQAGIGVARTLLSTYTF